jgi:hypothetical protein
VADHGSVVDVEVLEDGEQVVGVRVHVVAGPGLFDGAAVAAAVVGDAAWLGTG